MADREKKKKHKRLLVTYELELTFDPNETTNYIHMKLEGATIKQGDKEIGRIDSCIGGGIEISDKETGESWTLEPLHFWESYKKARDEGNILPPK